MRLYAPGGGKGGKNEGKARDSHLRPSSLVWGRISGGGTDGVDGAVSGYRRDRHGQRMVPDAAKDSGAGVSPAAEDGPSGGKAGDSPYQRTGGADFRDY